jgi:hypothetical protein
VGTRQLRRQVHRGDSGYTKSSENLLSGAGNLDTSLEDFSSGMNDAAKKIDDMDKSGNVK